MHAALDADGVGRVPRDDAAAVAARLFAPSSAAAAARKGGAGGDGAAGGEGGEGARGGGGSSSRESSASGTTRPLGFFGRDADAALACLTEQLDVLKRRLPNIARLASAQQRRALDGEELDGDDEGKDFDILLETAMADVVVEHAAATATKARDALAAALAREGGEGGAVGPRPVGRARRARIPTFSRQGSWRGCCGSARSSGSPTDSERRGRERARSSFPRTT